MGSVSLYIWSETVPNWLMAASAMAAVAVFFWRRQDRQESQAERESKIKDGLNAVWATAIVDSEGSPKWGVLVTNSLSAPVTGVRVTCTGNYAAEELSHKSIQPGRHFFESTTQGRPSGWALPKSNISSVEYITGSNTHSTRQLTFTYAGKTHSKSLD